MSSWNARASRFDHFPGEEAPLDDRRADAAVPPADRAAPVVRERGEPLLVGDQVAVQQELAEPDRLERGDGN